MDFSAELIDLFLQFFDLLPHGFFHGLNSAYLEQCAAYFILGRGRCTPHRSDSKFAAMVDQLLDVAS